MHLISTTVVLVAAMATMSLAAPASESRDPAEPINLTDVHLADDQATLETGPSNNGETAVRDKRTIGPLRQLFPGLSQIVDRKIQQITRVVFRLVGRLVLGQGNSQSSSSASGTSSGGGRRVSITLPTYPPLEEDEEEEGTEVPVTTDASATTPAESGNSIGDSSALSSAASSASSSNYSSGSASSSASASSAPNEAENQLGAESKVNEVRVPFKPAAKSADETEEGEEEQDEDLKPAASSDLFL